MLDGRFSYILCICLVGCALSACGEHSSDELYEQAVESVTAAGADSAQVDQAFRYYNAFIERFPEDPRCDDALRMLAKLSRQQGRMHDAIAHYERLLRDHPASDFGSEAQFMIAFILEEDLRQLDVARDAYRQVIEKFPGSELAVSARRLLPHVGENPEDWVPFQDGDEVVVTPDSSAE